MLTEPTLDRLRALRLIDWAVDAAGPMDAWTRPQVLGNRSAIPTSAHRHPRRVRGRRTQTTDTDRAPNRYHWRRTPVNLSRSSASLRSDHDAVDGLITMGGMRRLRCGWPKQVSFRTLTSRRTANVSSPSCPTAGSTSREPRAAWSSCRTSPTRYGGALADHGHADPENRRCRQTQDSSTLN